MENFKSFLIFVSAVLLVYGGTSYYLYRRIVQGTEFMGVGRWLFKLLLIGVILAYPLSRALGTDRRLGAVLMWIGAFWLGLLVYGVLTALLVDVIRYGDRLFGWLPRWALSDLYLTSRIVSTVSLVGILALLLAGHVRSLYPVVRELTVKLDRFDGDNGDLTMAMFADLHFGTLVGERRLKRVVEQVNGLGADAILIIGDLFDEDTARIGWAKKHLQNLDAPLGVYFVTGNHEYYAGLDGALAMVRDAGIKPLRNEAVVLNDEVVLVGLEDQTAHTQHGLTRVPLKQVLDGQNPNLPVILMHHTPTRRMEATLAGVDLMLSAHTHGGQLWPLGSITSLVFKAAQGYTRLGDMHFFLTNGVGTWGPPVRIGATPEIMHITITGSSSQTEV